MKTIIVYVSGHGYGHSVRTAEIVRLLAERVPECEVRIRGGLPSDVLRAMFPGAHDCHCVHLDPGIVERDGVLAIDAEACVIRLREFRLRSQAIVDDETAYVRRQRPSLLLADIPYLAGAIAESAGVPCIGIANFTWDWIYEPFLANRPQAAPWLAEMRRDYARMSLLLRLPFHHPAPQFPKLIDVPLVARHPSRPARDVLAELRVDPRDARTRVLIAMRVGLPVEVLAAMARQAGDFLFFSASPLPPGLPENLRHILPRLQQRFTDVLGACDVAVGKLGYGLVAECIACGTSLLFPPRSGFREDELLRPATQRFLTAAELPRDDYLSGCWLEHLRLLRQRPASGETLDADGAARCAELVGRQLEGKS